MFQICDISVPVNCTPELLDNDKDISVILGGVAQLPHGEKLPIKGFPLGQGKVFGCLGETLLLGMEGREISFSFGRITCQQIDEIAQIARKHGVELCMPKRKLSY